MKGSAASTPACIIAWRFPLPGFIPPALGDPDESGITRARAAVPATRSSSSWLPRSIRQRHATLLSSNYPASSSCVQPCILLAGHTRHAYTPSRSLNLRLDVSYYPSIHLAERQHRASEQAAQLLLSSCFTSDTKRTRRRSKKQPSKLPKIRPVAPPQRMRGKQLSTRAARRAQQHTVSIRTLPRSKRRLKLMQ